MTRFLILLLLASPALADQYEAYVDRVVDGDTIDCTISLGFGISVQKRVRMAGIDAPETRTRDLEEKARGIESKEWLVSRIQGQTVTLDHQGTGKFGRELGVILYQGSDINQEMVRFDLAEVY